MILKFMFADDVNSWRYLRLGMLIYLGSVPVLRM